MTLNSKCENAASGAAPDANIDGAAAEINMRSETEAFLNRIHAYVDHDLLPRRLAEERRKGGDSGELLRRIPEPTGSQLPVGSGIRRVHSPESRRAAAHRQRARVARATT